MTRSEAFYVLGLKPGASVEEAKAAWRNLVKLTHPDKDCSHDAAERFRKVQAAYQIIIETEASAAEERRQREAQEEREIQRAREEYARRQREVQEEREIQRAREQRARWQQAEQQARYVEATRRTHEPTETVDFGVVAYGFMGAVLGSLGCAWLGSLFGSDTSFVSFLVEYWKVFALAGVCHVLFVLLIVLYSRT